MRFIATADLQIGMQLRWLGDAQPVFDRARLGALTTIGRLVAETGAEAVVVAGDLFDREPVDAGDLARTLDAIGDLAVPVLVLPGNHDSHSPASVYRSKPFEKLRPPNISILLDDPIEIGGVSFIGAPLLTRNPDGPTLHGALAAIPADGEPRVAVGHGAVKQVVGDHGDPAAFDLDVIEEALEDGRVSLVVLGDRHSMQSVGATGRVWYPGAPEPTDFGDDDGHVLVVDVPTDGGVPTVEVRRTGTWRFVLLEPDLMDGADVAALVERIAALPSKATTNLKVRPSGVLPLEAHLALEEGLAGAQHLFASVQDLRERISVMPSEAEIAALPLPPYARRVLRELIDRGRDAPDDGAVRDQLTLLLRLARQVSA